MASPSDVLLLSGLPGAGKSRYAKWLAGRGWGRMDFDVNALAQTVLNAAINGSDERLLNEAGKYAPGLVFEWGFHPNDLHHVGKLVGRGYNAWYFDGDREAAFQSWRASPKNTRQPDDNWCKQVRGLDAHWPEIFQLYGSKIITTVGPGPQHLPEQEIHRLIGLE